MDALQKILKKDVTGEVATAIERAIMLLHEDTYGYEHICAKAAAELERLTRIEQAARELADESERIYYALLDGGLKKGKYKRLAEVLEKTFFALKGGD